ncbi:MAG: transposase [Bacteroidota bacterium]
MEQTNRKRKYRKYSSEFKSRALEKLENGEKALSISQQLGISTSLLYHWRKQSRVSPLREEEGHLSSQLQAKEKEIKELKKDVEVLKKALLLFSQSD